MGTYNLIAEKKMNMQDALKITAVVNGQTKDVKPAYFSENIVCQNTSFWGGGCFDIWDSYKDVEVADTTSISSDDSMLTMPRGVNYEARDQDAGYKIQTHTDKLLEMMSFRSLFHMGQIQIGLAKADRLTQAR